MLRKVDFQTYKSDGNHREHEVMRRYGIQKRDDYGKYNRLAGSLRQLAHKIAALEPTDPFRKKSEDSLVSKSPQAPGLTMGFLDIASDPRQLEKLFDMGILGTGGGGRGKLSDVENKVTVSSFCRRRLPVVMTKLRMAGR